MSTSNQQKIIFSHMIELPSSQCVFCVTKDVKMRTRIFLVFKDKDKIYSRNGLLGTWDEIQDKTEVDTVRQGFEQAIIERKIPCFRADDDDNESHKRFW